MQNSKRPYFDYDPPPKTHFLAKIAFGLIAVLIVVAIIALVKEKHNDSDNEMITATTEEKAPLEIKTGQSLHTRYFDVMVEKVSVFDKIADGNQMAILPKSDSSQYLVIEIAFKNRDAESKLMPDGELHIENEGDEIKYGNSETIIKEGWGQLMDNIAPGITKKTKFVYKIPAVASGKAYYYPDILYNQDRIFLMNL